MSTRMFCDRCGADITDKTSAGLRGIADVDPQGNGTITFEADLCAACYRACREWVQTRPPTKARRVA
jgi:hypothetical protein